MLAALSVHVLAHPHVGVLFPERVLVNHGVVCPVQIERIRDERFSLFPDFNCLLCDESLFTPLRGDVSFFWSEHRVGSRNALLTSEGEGFLRGCSHEFLLYLGELLVPHFPET